jgi:hypothetical protein
MVESHWSRTTAAQMSGNVVAASAVALAKAFRQHGANVQHAKPDSSANARVRRLHRHGTPRARIVRRVQ